MGSKTTKEKAYTAENFLRDIRAVGFIEAFAANELTYFANPLAKRNNAVATFISLARKAILEITLPYFANKISLDEVNSIFLQYVELGKKECGIDFSEEFNQYFDNLKRLREHEEVCRLIESGELEKLIKKEDITKLKLDRDKDVT